MRQLVTAVLIGASLAASAAYAQSETPRRKPVPNNSYNQNRGTVSTYPSNSPFSNPISQPLPPAVSVNPAQNSNRGSVPIQGYR